MFFTLSNSLTPAHSSLLEEHRASPRELGRKNRAVPARFLLPRVLSRPSFSTPPPTWYDSMRTPICCMYFAKRPTSKLTICPPPPHTLKHPGMWAQILNSDCIWSAKRIAFWIINYLAQPFRRVNLYSNKVQSCEAWKI